MKLRARPALKRAAELALTPFHRRWPRHTDRARHGRGRLPVLFCRRSVSTAEGGYASQGFPTPPSSWTDGVGPGAKKGRKTVGPLNRYGWWKRQDGAIRRQVIEQLMHQIMQYDTEFRREEATSAVGSNAVIDRTRVRAPHSEPTPIVGSDFLCCRFVVVLKGQLSDKLLADHGQIFSRARRKPAHARARTG